jgi:hypothetical protein
MAGRAPEHVAQQSGAQQAMSRNYGLFEVNDAVVQLVVELDASFGDFQLQPPLQDANRLHQSSNFVTA